VSCGLDGETVLAFPQGALLKGRELEARALPPPFNRRPPAPREAIADATGRFFALGHEPKLHAFDGSLDLVMTTVHEVRPGPFVVGPDATVLVCSTELGIVQVIA
jgi:hypothetical protein